MQVRHVILDRDGVINREAIAGHVTQLADWAWEDGALDGLCLLAKAGVRVSVATNQSAVSTGRMTMQTLAAIHERMLTEAARAGAHIDAVFVCAHAPSANCDCRKPKPGLVHSALRAADSTAADTLLVGDDLRDLQAAWSAGVSPVLVRTGKGNLTAARLPRGTVPMFDNLRSLAETIVGGAELVEPPADSEASRIFLDHARVVAEAALQLPRHLDQLALLIWCRLARGNKLLACGNGGSAADAQHLVAELTGRFLAERQPLAAIDLAGNSSTLTAIANDYGYEQVFARQVAALARPGDVFLGISTSGNSGNVIAAAEIARDKSCTVVALTGADGGKLGLLADLRIAAPSANVARIQEIHGICIHAIAAAIDQRALDAQRQ